MSVETLVFESREKSGFLKKLQYWRHVEPHVPDRKILKGWLKENNLNPI